MRWVKVIFAGIAAILKAILPFLLKEGKKPKKIKMVGKHEELQDAIEDEIKGQIDGTK